MFSALRRIIESDDLLMGSRGDLDRGVISKMPFNSALQDEKAHAQEIEAGISQRGFEETGEQDEKNANRSFSDFLGVYLCDSKRLG